MTKEEAIRLHGGTQRRLSQALGLSESAVSQWPDELTERQEDRVLGAAVRLGIPLGRVLWAGASGSASDE